MSEKQQEGLAARKSGTYVAPKQETPSSVATLINNGTYKLVYDGAGLHTAGPSNSNPDSTWYEFHIQTASGKTVGHYHVHPRVDGSWASGNLRLNDGSSFGSYIVGRALDWVWLANDLAKKAKPASSAAASTPSATASASSSSSSSSSSGGSGGGK